MLEDWIHKDDFTGNNQVRLLRGGRLYFDHLEELIHSAKKEIHFQTYIFEADETGTQILSALEVAAGRGVVVHLVLDAFGSQSLSKAFLNRIRESGIQFRYFGRMFSDNLSWGRRMHHKVIVIDSSVCIVGGINVSNRYNEIKEQPAWLDYALEVEGPLALEARRRCLQVLGKRARKIRPQKGSAKKEVLARLRVNDWLRGRSQITLSLARAVHHAQRSIIIVAAYFTPTTSLMIELRKAAARGVDVRIILAWRSDVWLEKRASRYLYNWMLRNHLQIYEWYPSVLHAKVAMVDDHWVTIGSYNLNFLSIFESLELNIEVADEPFAHLLKTELEEVISSGCNEVDVNDYQDRRFRDWLSLKLYGWLSRIFAVLNRRPPGTKRIPLKRLLTGKNWE